MDQRPQHKTRCTGSDKTKSGKQAWTHWPRKRQHNESTHTKTNNYQLGCHDAKNLLSSKEHHHSGKRQPKEWKKVFTNYTRDTYSCFQNMQRTNTNKQAPSPTTKNINIKEMTKLNTRVKNQAEFSKDKMKQTAEKHILKCSLFLVTNEM